MDDDSSASIISINENKIIEKSTGTDDTGSNINDNEETEVNTIEIDDVALIEAYPREVKIDIDINIEDSTEKLKNELNYKDSKNRFTKAAERIIALDRRILMTTWFVFPALFSKLNLRPQASQVNDDEAVDNTKQEAPPIDSRTRPQQNQGGGYNSGGYTNGGYNTGGGGGGGFEGGGMMQNRMGIGPEYDPYERNSFIAVVFGIVLIMLIVTAICLGMIFMIEPLFEHVRHMAAFYMIAAFILYVVLTYCFVCGPCSRNPCCGTTLLVLTTFVMTALAAAIMTHYKFSVIIYGVIATAIVCIVCMLLALSRFDFTGCLIYVIVCGVVLSFIAIAVMIASVLFHVYFKPVILALLVGTALTEAVTMIIQLQMILGHRALEYDEGEYFLAAFQLYTSVVQMMITLVQILGLIDSM